MSRELVVWCRGDCCGIKKTLKYIIHEYQGQLQWRHHFPSDGEVPPESPVYEGFARFNAQCGEFVSDADAEILTGLHSPAAMDRLREMLHEQPVFTEAT